MRQIGICVLTTAILVACGSEVDERSATEKALDELQAKYDALREKDFDDPLQWAAEDLENIGDWEYKVETFSRFDPEDLEEALNKLGDERWEVIWIEKSSAGHMVLLKKPSVSYLNKIPLSGLGRFIIDDSPAE